VALISNFRNSKKFSAKIINFLFLVHRSSFDVRWLLISKEYKKSIRLLQQDKEMMADNINEDDTDDDTYIKTTTHNYVSRRAIIDGAKQVEIRGRSIIFEKVKVCGDLSIIKIGRYVEIGSSTLLEPSQNPYNQDNNNSKKYIPMIIGSHTHIGKECTIQAAAIGSSK